MPQIAQLAETYASQFFWMLVFFGIVYIFIGNLMVPKVMATVEQRDRQIASDLAAAEAARSAADAQEEAWRVQSGTQRAEAQALIAKAKAEAAKATETRLAAAGAKLDAQVDAADARIAEARAGALGELEAVAVEAATDIAKRLAGLKVDARSAKSAVKEALNA
jgi:F-type H+-transporting ATPase subunit b